MSHAAEGNEPAWERRKEIGFFPAIFKTMTSVLFHPNATFAKLKHTGGFGVPLSYYLLVMVATMALILAASTFRVGGLGVNDIKL